MEAQVKYHVTLETETCYKCGIPFAAPSWFIRERRKDKEAFWCPNGHSQAYIESEADRLRKKLDEQTREATRQAARAAQIAAERDAEAAARAKAERKLRRVQKGVCPECNRSFPNLERHMACKHGEKKSLSGREST